MRSGGSIEYLLAYALTIFDIAEDCRLLRKCTMPRISVGTQVKIVGAIAEHYATGIAVVVRVMPHPQGLPHLNQYRVYSSCFGEDTFYEFQLAPTLDGTEMKTLDGCSDGLAKA
jgi:hypothetical protein